MEEATTLYGFKFREPDERRRVDNEPKPFDIKQLWQRSHEILNLALLGHKQTEIAKMLNVHPQTITNTLNSSLGMEALADKRKVRDEKFEGFHDKVMELTERSLKVYEKILSASTNPLDEDFNPLVPLKMQKEAADTVTLELSGLRVPTKVDSRSVHLNLSDEELDEFKRRGIEAAKSAGKVVDVVDE